MPSAERRSRRGDRLFGGVLLAAGGAIVGVLVAIAWICGRLALPTLSKLGVVAFVTGRDWDPVRESFGALPFLYGTVVTALLALLIAAPVAIGIALFTTEMAPLRAQRIVRSLVEILAAIPSVVYGLWGLMVLVPLLRTTIEPALQQHLGFLPLFDGPALGVGYLAAGLLLAVMILPTIAAVTIEVLRTAPQVLREGALALGATRWEAIRMVVLPYCRRGILGAVILGLARALGETMAVTMVIGNQPEIHGSLLAAGYSLPAVIANEFAEATGAMHTGALAALALCLLVVTLLLNAGARVLVRLSSPRAEARA